MNLKNIALISSLSLLTASAAFAEGQMPEPDNTGFFIAGSIGNSVGPQTIAVDASGFGVTAYAGSNQGTRVNTSLYTLGYFGALAEIGYNFMENFGVEAYGAYLGQQKSLNGTVTMASELQSVKLTSWVFGGNLLGYIPLADHTVDIILKLGLGGMYSKISAGGTNFTNNLGRNFNTTQGIYDFGVGGQYYYTDDVTFRASWDQFSRWSQSGGIANLRYNLFTLGVDYHFTI